MYKSTETDVVFKEDVGWIPADPDNVEYQKFLKWVDAGNTPEPYVAPIKEPEVTPVESKVLLVKAGFTSQQVDAILVVMTTLKG